MLDIDSFYKRIPDVETLSNGDLIPYFAYYCTLEKDFFNINEIYSCYDLLSLERYSNVSSYISSKIKGKKKIFIKEKQGYKLHREAKMLIASKLNEIIDVPITSDFLDVGILDNTRDNIKQVAVEMCKCYQIGAYTASFVLMRKLLETYIIECFDSHQCLEEITDTNGDFYHLSELISKYLSCTKWAKTRNMKQHLLEIKKLGDQCAHNRYFTGRKSDMDSIRLALRQVLEEIINIIDYDSWNDRIKQDRLQKKK